jgi:DNA-binding CsgD family transcriptional regulator
MNSKIVHLPTAAAGGECSANTLARLLDLIYEGPLESKPWQGFLERLREVTNATRVSLQLHCAESLEDDIRVFATHPDNLIDWQALKELYRRKYMDDDPIQHFKLAPGRIATIQDCRGSRNYQELLMPMQITHVVRTCFGEPGGMKCALELAGHAPFGPFDARRDVQLLRELLPHLARALRLYVRIMRAQSEKSVYQEAIGHLAFGCVFLDGEGRIIDSNPIADTIIRRHPEIRVTRGLLRLRDRESDVGLQRAIARAIELRRKHGPGRAHVDLVRLLCQSGALLGFLVLPAPLITFYQGEHTPNVVVYISDFERRIGDVEERRRSAEQLVGKMFALTKAEAKLAVLLADGLTMSEAAVELGITEGSVRTYSKNIYEKTDIKRQTDLIRLIYKSVALLG